ncbi:MAG: hypothetical protein H6561_13880 [Lewinellaceae bacterium]|nr:hypothetical protein [Lewinellaceae bacterium]
MNTMRTAWSVIIFSAVVILACSHEQSYIPKPRAYPKITFPQKGYQPFHVTGCPLTFAYPSYATIDENPSNRQSNQQNATCWFDIFFPEFNGRIHCSYVSINKPEDLDKYISDAFEIVDKVNYRSNYSGEEVIHKPDGTGGVVFNFEGPAASPVQFFLTDSTEHFFKGSLYFYAKVNPDSIQPIANFIEQDVMELIKTLEWTDK